MSRTRYNSDGGFGRTHGFDEGTADRGNDGNLSGTEDIDIDFSITESGRTVAHLIANLKDDDTMDFSITDSGRTIDRYPAVFGSVDPNGTAALQAETGGTAKAGPGGTDFSGQTINEHYQYNGSNGQGDMEEDGNMADHEAGAAATAETSIPTETLYPQQLSTSEPTEIANMPPASSIATTVASGVTTMTTVASRSQSRVIPGQARKYSEDSTGLFLQGMMESLTASSNNPASKGLAGTLNDVLHTPPTSIATSYEKRHFGKRMRSGVSILDGYNGSVSSNCSSLSSSPTPSVFAPPPPQSVSGRLRSASDLEDRGIIDRTQKGLLKDLIIAGDEALQDALDKYEKGDASRLEDMIKSGALSGRFTNDVDLLGDLDLDFLTVDDTGLGGNIEPAASILGMMPGADGASLLAGANQQQQQQQQHDDDAQNEQHRYSHRVTPSHPDDFGTVASGTDRDRSGSEAEFLHPMNAPGDPSSADEVDSRLRSNSLAFGVLQNEQMTYDTTYGRWVDRTELARSRNNSVSGEGLKKQQQQQRNSGKPFGSTTTPTTTTTKKKSTTSGSKKKTPDSSNKLTRAEERKRERQRKKEQRDREKQLEKELKETIRQQKKERRGRPKKDQVGRKSRAEKKSNSNVATMEEKAPVVSGTGRPRSMSDPNLRSTVDPNGLLCVDRPDGWVGAYSPESRKIRIERFMKKRNHRVWTKSVKYDVRKNFADSRLRVKGRFVKKEDELLMRELMSLT